MHDDLNAACKVQMSDEQNLWWVHEDRSDYTFGFAERWHSLAYGAFGTLAIDDSASRAWGSEALAQMIMMNGTLSAEAVIAAFSPFPSRSPLGVSVEEFTQDGLMAFDSGWLVLARDSWPTHSMDASLNCVPMIQWPEMPSFVREPRFGRSERTEPASALNALASGGTARVLDLATLSIDQGFVLRGDDVLDGEGQCVSSAGDVNGDGIDDIIVGAESNVWPGVAGEGRAFIIYGRAGRERANLELAHLSAADGFAVRSGDPLDTSVGHSVSGAGDFNGDGLDDIIISVPWGRYGAQYEAGGGGAYVIFGSAGGTRVDIDLSILSADDGFRIADAASSYDTAGFSVSSAGDINGDGYDDLVLGAPRNDSGGNDAGLVYVVFGRSNDLAGGIGLSSFRAGDGFRIIGSEPSNAAGLSVSGAGDINGDGISDVILGAPSGVPGTYEGSAYIIFGRQGPSRGDIDLSSLHATDGFRIHGIPHGLGNEVSLGGDINGDGIDDAIVLSPGAKISSGSYGEVHVVFGRVGATRADVNLSVLTPSDGFSIINDVANVSHIRTMLASVSSAGDVNGDGVGDIIIGSPVAPGGGLYAGETYVVFGRAGGNREDIQLSNLSHTDGFVIHGGSGEDYSGTSVSSAGDINGDGYDDLLVGAPFGTRDNFAPGAAYVIYGSRHIGDAFRWNFADPASADVMLFAHFAQDAYNGGGAATRSGIIRAPDGWHAILTTRDGAARLCCTNWLLTRFPLSPDRLIPRFL